ncbi:hypothetical protein FE257_001960 [Aspergillus nanangensis]|uniref:Nephrocystin 3-like N-terminal domain-containing protein n=1 Tax=Aspergillus nanangensis TaxID=2582783 RepID=A0AAD4CDE6_ASPNN|nr:hypothetical protein FE257_001960 [Aspergillus nanangensis]
MATSFQPTVHYTFGSPRNTTSIVDSRRVSGILESDNVSSRVFNSVTSRRGSRKLSAGEPSNLADVVNSLRRRNSSEMDSLISSRLMNATHSALNDWIRAERMTKLPPEGSSYDRVLVWASLFVDRLHSFDLAVEQFAGDSHLAAQLVYGYCTLLLELGEENSSALMVMFAFFCNCSQELVNLLDRAELFMVSQDIKDQLVLALADLVTLVVCVATHFHKSLRGIGGESISIDIYSSFPGPIESFRNRCEHVSGLMWRHQLLREGFDEAKVSEVQAIKHWLEPEDPVLANITQTAAHWAQDREELTCLWMTPYLTRFLKSDKKSLAISGKPGSGKTILSSVMIDHLQYPIGGVSYKPIFVPINSRVPAKATPRGIVKTILAQIFDKRIGNVRLYEILADACERSHEVVDSDEYDNILWSALGSALQASMRGAKELVLVVDGLDEATCGETALVNKLKQITTNADNLKLVLLGAQKQSTTKDQTVLNITPELVFDDIAAVVRNILEPYSSFEYMSEEQREVTVNRITEAADGSFLWAKLACKQLRSEGAPNSQALSKSVESLVKAGYTIQDLVTHSLQSKSLSEDGKMVLCWLATAPRPLSLREIPALLSIQLDKGTLGDREVDPRQLLKSVSSLVFCQNGLMYLRHGQIRTALSDISQQGKFLPAIKNRHADITRRLLLYTKITVTSEHEPSLTPLEPQITGALLDKHPLLDFAIRYWIDHTQAAFGCTTDAEVTTAVKELRSVMPTCSTVPLLSMTIWQPKATPVQEYFYSLQTRFYEQVLTAKHPTTLQSVLCRALFYRQLHETAPSKATWVLYEAVKMCHDVLTARNIVTMRLSEYFLDITADQVTESRTEIMMKRVQVLQVLVECYKIHYTASSEMVTGLLTQLAEHYHAIKEEAKAQEIYIGIRENPSEAPTPRPSYHKATDDSLRVNIHGRRESTDLGTTLLLDEIEEDELISAASEASIESLLKMADTYKAQKKMQLVESAYVEAWQRASKEFRLSRSAELEVRNIQAVLTYARFLQSQSRTDEAASLLAGLWQEHEQCSKCSSPAVVQALTEVAKTMQRVNLSAIALNIFKHCQQFYEGSSGHHSAAYKEIQQIITTTSQQVMHSASQASSSVSESVLTEMIYDSLDSLDATTISAINSLVETYTSQHRWHDATSLIKRVLRSVWPQFFAMSIQDISLPAKHLEFVIHLAERLGDCYHSRRRRSKEEDTRNRLYQSLRRSRQPGDKVLDRTTTALLRLYQRTLQTDKVIHLQQEMLADYTKKLGPEHPTVIRKLWTLAELTSPRPVSVDYYRQIVTILNKKSDTCHPDAFEPLLIVVNDLWNKERYADALEPSRVLFNTLRNPKISPKLRDQAFVRMVFNRYTQCLRAARVDTSVIHDVAAQYRSMCQTVFGESASITIQATTTLANICQESTQYESEAVKWYRHLLTLQSDEIDREEIEGTLEAMDEKHRISWSSDKVSSLSSEQIQEVITQYSQHLTWARSEHGWAHQDSLDEMDKLVTLHANRGEYIVVANLLKEATVEILKTETSAIRLSAAAKAIAASYISSGQIHRGRELTQELYRQIVAKDTSNASTVQFNLSSHARESLMFLSQLEYSLREDTSLTLNEIFSSLITEYLYFDQFRSDIRAKSSSVQSVTTSAARLYRFLAVRGRQTILASVVDQFADFFVASEGSRLHVSGASQVRELVVTMVEYFTRRSSQNFLRSVAIASYNRVCQLLAGKKYQAACDLALTSFRFIHAHEGYSQLPTLKLAFKLGMAISGRQQTPRASDDMSRKTMLEISSTIMKETVRMFKRMKIDLTRLGQENLNSLIGLLDEQQDYNNLAWVLTTLWDSRDTPDAPQPYFIITLARMLIITRYLVGDYMSSMRLAEDIVYNCARVHGSRHPHTFDMTVLLSQLYTSVAQRYQAQQDGQDMAHRYYKKAAALHENALRAFIDPSSVQFEYAGTESGMESDDAGSSTPGEALEDEGKHVRQHFHLLKLAVERLGGWPKEYAEYERLNAELFQAYPDDLKGVEGVEKWNLQNFGSGRAESTDDLVATGVQQGVSLDVRDLGGLAIAV